LVPNHARRARAGTRRLPAGAPFAELRPPPESLQTALPSPHCLMTRCLASTLIWLAAETAESPVSNGQMVLTRAYKTRASCFDRSAPAALCASLPSLVFYLPVSVQFCKTCWQHTSCKGTHSSYAPLNQPS